MTSTMDLAQLYALAYVNESHGTDDGNMSTFDELCRKRDVARAALEQRIKELERDALRYKFIRDGGAYVEPAEHDEDGNVVKEMYMATKNGKYYADLRDFDMDLDAAMSEAALTKAVEISQEYKLP